MPSDPVTQLSRSGPSRTGERGAGHRAARSAQREREKSAADTFGALVAATAPGQALPPVDRASTCPEAATGTGEATGPREPRISASGETAAARPAPATAATVADEATYAGREPPAAETPSVPAVATDAARQKDAGGPSAPSDRTPAFPSADTAAPPVAVRVFPADRAAHGGDKPGLQESAEAGTAPEPESTPETAGSASFADAGSDDGAANTDRTQTADGSESRTEQNGRGTGEQEGADGPSHLPEAATASIAAPGAATVRTSAHVFPGPAPDAPLSGPPVPDPVRHALHNIAETAGALRHGAVEIALAPEELGQVTLTLKAHDTGATVVLHADRPETLDLMRRHADLLAQDLRDSGYRDLTFQFQDRPSGQDQSRPSQPAAPPQNDTSFPATAPVSHATVPGRHSPGADGTLDLRF